MQSSKKDVKRMWRKCVMWGLVNFVEKRLSPAAFCFAQACGYADVLWGEGCKSSVWAAEHFYEAIAEIKYPSLLSC